MLVPQRAANHAGSCTCADGQRGQKVEPLVMTRLAVLVDYSRERGTEKGTGRNALVTGLRPNESTAALVGSLRLVEVVSREGRDGESELLSRFFHKSVRWLVGLSLELLSLRLRNGDG